MKITGFAAALLGATMLAATPALAQGQSSQGQSSQGWQDQRRAWSDWQPSRNWRDWVESRDYMDPYDRWLQAMRRDRERDGGIGEQAWSDRRAQMMDRLGRFQFERGYRAGREDERRRQGSMQGSMQRDRGMQGSGGEGRSASSGGVAQPDYYWVIPDILPDTPLYRGMQDFALIPDYSNSMDRLLIAAQSLREAIQATAQIPVSDRRDRAIDLLHEALIETQQAMLAIPPEQRLR